MLPWVPLSVVPTAYVKPPAAWFDFKSGSSLKQQLNSTVAAAQSSAFSFLLLADSRVRAGGNGEQNSNSYNNNN